MNTIKCVCTYPCLLISNVTNVGKTIDTCQKEHTFEEGEEVLYNEEFKEITTESDRTPYKITDQLFEKCFSIIEDNKVMHHKRIDISTEGLSAVDRFVSSNNVTIILIKQPTKNIFDIFYTCGVRQ